MARKRGGRTLPVGLDRRVRGYNTDSLLTLATAAGASPTAGHRWASLAHLIAHTLSAAPHRGGAASADRLPGLLDACIRDNPGLHSMEDFVPADPRLEVVVRRDNALLRLFPGSVERPVADVERAVLLSESVDNVLIPQLGFGIADYTDVGLHYLNHAVRIMAPAWSNGKRPSLDDGPYITDDELEAARSLLAQPMPSALRLTPSQRAALEWATVSAEELPYRPDHPQSVFGHFFLVSIPARAQRESKAEATSMARWWLPPAFLPEALGFGAAELAHRAAGEPIAAHRFARGVAARARRALWRFGPVLGPPDDPRGPVVSPGDVVQWIVLLGQGRAVLVQILARLALDQLSFMDAPAAVRIAERAAADPSSPIEVPMPGGQLTLDPRTEVVPLLLVATVGHVVAPQMPGAAGMALEDLIWASRTADAESDLFMFCRELADPNRSRMFGWEAINYWEWWRANGKTFFAGGRPPDFMAIEAHRGEAEWEWAARMTPLERALAVLNLAPVADYDVIDADDEGPPGVYAWAPNQGRTV